MIKQFSPLRHNLALATTLAPIIAIVGGYILFGLHNASQGLGAEEANAAPQFTEYDLPTPKSCPRDIALGPDGNMWFTEACNNGKIGRISVSGKITEIEVPKKDGGPTQIQPGPEKKLWFNWFAVGKIGSISVSGAVEEYQVTDGEVHGLAFGSDGNLWFGDLQGNAIGRMTPEGTVTKFPLTHKQRHPDSLTAAKDGNIWFVEDYGVFGALGRITIQGNIEEYALHPAHPSATRPRDFPAIGDIAVATDGAVWFAESNLNRIARRSTTGAITEYAIPTPKSRTVTTVSGTQGDAWFTEGYGNKFGHVTSQGKITEYKIPTTDSGPDGIALDSNGTVWVVEQSANKILKAVLLH